MWEQILKKEEEENPAVQHHHHSTSIFRRLADNKCGMNARKKNASFVPMFSLFWI